MFLKILFNIVRRRVGLHCDSVPELLGGRPWSDPHHKLTDGSDRHRANCGCRPSRAQNTSLASNFFFPPWNKCSIKESSALCKFRQTAHSAPCLPACVNYIFPSLTKAYQLRPSTNENESRLESQFVRI